MLKKRGKQIISVLLVAVTCLLLVFSTIAIVYNSKKKYKEPSASGVFTFERDGSYFGDDEDKENGVTIENNQIYNDNYEFHIDSPEGLMSFSRSVAEGYDFKGKKVKLLNDIDWNDMNYDIYDDKDTARTFVPIGANAWGGTYYGCKPFRGVFDGGSNTISNLHTKFYYGQASVVGLGLFAYATGSPYEDDFYVADISFVNIENYTMELDTMGGVIYIGGVVGLGHMIQTRCCLVENLSLINWWHNPNLYFAGIIGACTFLGEIDDCYVDDINVETHNNGNYPTFTSYFGPSVDIALTVIYLTKCIAADKDETDLEGYALHYQNNNPYVDPMIKIQTNEIFKKTDDKTIRNEVRSLFSDDIINELDWHMCPESIVDDKNAFNDGWPYPKWFIDFEEYIFYNDNSSFATMTFDDFIETYKVINIPREVTIDINDGSTFAMVYGLPVKIEVKDGYYAGFQMDGDKVYKVFGGGEIYKLKFSALINHDGSNSSYSPKCEYIEIHYGQDIKIEMKMENGFTCLYFGDTLVYDNLPKIYAIKNSIEVFNSSIKKQTLNLGYNNIEDLGNHKDVVNCNIYYDLKSYGLEIK